MATKEALAPLANGPIMLGRLIWSLTHPKRPNPSTGNDFMSSSGKNVLVQFLATKEALAPLANVPIMSGRSILLCSHIECQNPSIISNSIDSARCGKKSGMTAECRNETEDYNALYWSFDRKLLNTPPSVKQKGRFPIFQNTPLFVYVTVT